MQALCRLLSLTQAVVHSGKDGLTGHSGTGNSIHASSRTGLEQCSCQSFGSGAAQFGSLAGSVDLHTGHPAASLTDGTYTSSAQGYLSDVTVKVTVTGGRVTGAGPRK